MLFLPSFLVSTSMLFLPVTVGINIQPEAIMRKTLKMIIKIPRIDTARRTVKEDSAFKVEAAELNQAFTQV